jgi:putative oxidoreductase
MRRIRTGSIWIASIFLAAVFMMAGILMLVNPVAIETFVRWGYPDWLRQVVGALEIAGAFLLLVPRWAWFSAAVLAVLLAGAGAMYLWNGQLAQAALHAALVVVLAIVGYLRHPRASLVRRLKAAADAFAEREIAQERLRLASPKLSSLHDSSVGIS